MRSFNILRWAVTLVTVVASSWAAESTNTALAIRLNTVGYLPGHEKKATVAQSADNFTVVRVKDGAKVFTGKISGASTNADTGEALFVADFTSFNEPGEYRLEAPGAGASAPFRIGPGIYREPYQLAVRAMYLWRCGTAVSSTNHGEVFAHAICHTNDAWLDVATGEHRQVPSLKGWHDAGDFNKYTVNAGITVGCMFRAWEDFGAKIKNLPLGLPEAGGALPELLAEIKWEMDWLLTMQFPDGSVSHKVSTKKFCGFIMPEMEQTNRLFTPWGSAATADFVAMAALSARHFKTYDPAYAQQCLAAAQKSYAFLQAHPEDHRPKLEGFETGAYQSGDADDRLWAAAELWETTGDSAALADLETRVARARADGIWDWGNVQNLGLFTYVLSQRTGRNDAVVQKARETILAVAEGILADRNAHGYSRPAGKFYTWGCNGTVARQVMNLQIANRLSPKPEFKEAALDALNHLLGRNVHGRSYVTGIGWQPPLRPHDRRSGADTVDAPWPGYLVGGPNPRARDWFDVQEDYRTNEIAINWNGALIYALAGFVSEP